MLGSKYNDKKERLESSRASFYLTPSDVAAHLPARRIRSTGTTASPANTITSSADGLPATTTTGLRRHSIAAETRSRSVDSGIITMSSAPFHANNPQDDYGSTTRRSSFSSQQQQQQEERNMSSKETPLLASSSPSVSRRSKSMINIAITQRSCGDLGNLDEKPLLDVVDRIEDEVEAHAYEDLVPLEIKLALENRIFGWSHLSSSILGHILHTVGSFLLAFFVLTSVHDFYQAHNPNQKQQGGGNDDDPAYAPDLEPDELWFKTLRLAIASFCAFSTFRMVRRRRHVWFRNAYGSKDYHKDAARRRRTVRETDQKTLLGRLMRRGNELMQRRVQRRLVKAHNLFQKRQQRHQERLRLEQEKLKQQQKSIPEEFDDSNNTTEQDLLCSPQSVCYSPCDSFCGGEYNVLDEPSHTEYSHSESSGSSASDDDETIEAFMKLPSLSQQLNPDVNHNLQSRRQRRRTFRTKPTTKMESIMHDQILFRRGPIINMPYAHGGFFGAAPFMLANPHWISILRHLMPDVYVEISRRVAYAPSSRLIHWAENNPVVAAYGVAHDLERGIDYAAAVHHTEQRVRTTPNLEWDVFLDPYLVDDVEVVLQERDKYLSTILLMEHYSFYETHKPLGLSLDDWLDSINEAAVNSEHISAKIEFTESQRQILKYYADQLEGRAQVLVDEMLIAHGKLTHLIYEALGLAKRYNYSRVKRTRKALGGGIYARQWMAVYAEALKFGLYDDRETISQLSDGESVTSSIKNVDSFISTSLDALANAKCPDSSIAESVATIQSILRRRGDDTIDTEFPVGLVLDIKSRHVSRRVWACVVDTLRAAGVRVVGLASFTVDEIRGISKFCSEPLMEVIFFHSAGDLQRACHEGKIRYGDKVFFNCGSLLWEGTPPILSTVSMMCSLGFDPEQSKRNYRILPCGRTRKMYDGDTHATSSQNIPRPSSMTTSSAWMEGSTVELYKERYGLSIGLYAQEFAIDDRAANMIVELVNENSHVYDLGLSWGGVNGITIRGIQPGRFTSTDGLWNQRYIGSLWDSNRYPPPRTSPVGTPPSTPTLQEKQQ